MGIDQQRLVAAVAVALCAVSVRSVATNSVSVDWQNAVRKNVVTSAQIEVDFMPFLDRNSRDGNFDGYYTALSDLGAENMRFSPWFGYPRVVVTELEPSPCPGSNWNSTIMDGVMADFMAAVCGLDAKEGKCEHSVSQQVQYHHHHHHHHTRMPVPPL